MGSSTPDRPTGDIGTSGRFRVTAILAFGSWLVHA
jgi:hypothetical protein